METDKKQPIIYPYLPEGKDILYVPEDNEYIQIAKEFAKENSLDKIMPNGSVIVKDGEIIGRGANGSTYHDTHECERVKQKMPTGVGYEICEGCHPKNHGEPKAIKEARDNGKDLIGADIYLWGHWWCCESCWNSMLEAGIKDVYLMKNSEILFDRTNNGNIIGHQFD